LANAKVKGKPLGYPPVLFSRMEKDLLLLEHGKTYPEAVRQTRIS